MALIEGFRVQNYRALRDVTLGCISGGSSKRAPLTPFTVVIGKNGSGKSTLFDALAPEEVWVLEKGQNGFSTIQVGMHIAMRDGLLRLVRRTA